MRVCPLLYYDSFFPPSSLLLYRDIGVSGERDHDRDMGVVTEIVMGTGRGTSMIGRGTSMIGRGMVTEDVATVDGSHDRDHDRKRSRYIIIIRGEGLIKEYLSSPTTPPPFIATSITISFGRKINFSQYQFFLTIVHTFEAALLNTEHHH